jgi:SAM-dependent methyltransferase
VMLMLHQRAARLRARELAIAEAVSLLADANPVAEVGGPLAEQRGVAWISIDALDLEDRVPLLGYVDAVDVVEPARASDRETVRWRRRMWRLRRIHTDDPEQLRQQAPDRRVFVVQAPDGTRVIRGYRGSDRTLERRGLPVIDARLLVNLATHGGQQCRLLDPFAGVGGIVIAADDAAHLAFSTDIDPKLAVGLELLTRRGHAVADATRLPFGEATFDGIATETPFEPAADVTVSSLLPELARVLRRRGRLAVMCVERQARLLRERTPALQLLMDHEIDRKGFDVRVLVWERG